MNEITRLLGELAAGKRNALDELMPLIYPELRRIARRRVGGLGKGRTLQPTALVHEAYLELVDQPHATWRDRAHFFALAARVMRSAAVDHARSQHAAKRGGGAAKATLDEASVRTEHRDPAELLALDAALERLAALDSQQARIVELRFFGGLSVEETAEALGISTATVKRDWSMAKKWLYSRML